MSTTTIETAPVLCAIEYKYRPAGSAIVKHVVLLSQISCELQIPSASFNATPLSGSGNSSQVRWRAHGTGAKLKIASPDLSTEAHPAELEPQTRYEKCTVSGGVVLKQVAQRRYRVMVGSLACEFPTGWRMPRPLLRLWPYLVEQSAGWAFSFLADGLCLSGPFRTISEDYRITLLLPQAPRQRADTAWGSGLAGVVPWPSELTQEPALDHRDYAPDVPDLRQWPAEKDWVARRWHLLDDGSAGKLMIDLCLEFQPDSVLTLADAQSGMSTVPRQRGAQGDSTPPQAHIVECLDVDRGKIVTRGLVVDRLHQELAATLRWPQAGRSTYLRPERIRCGLAPVGSPSRLDRTHLTLSTGAIAASKADATMAWPPAPGPASLSTKMTRTGLLYAGLAGRGGSAVDLSKTPTHLCLQQGSLSLASLPTSAGGVNAQDLLHRIAGSAQMVRGGIPLSGPNVPADLIAWVADRSAGTPGSTSMRLRLLAAQTKIELWDPIYTWRTPAWWLRDGSGMVAEDRSTSGWEVFAPVLEERFGEADASDRIQGELFAGALADVLVATRWIGGAGVPTTTGWSLETSAGTTRVVVPASAPAARPTVWMEINEAALVNTRATSRQPGGTLLLDPGRALTPLRQIEGQIRFTIVDNRLPTFDPHPFSSPEAVPGLGQPAGDEMFFPLIPGLTYNPRTRRFCYRHGLPLLVESFLRMRADGSISSTASNSPLELVRPSDDVAIVDSNGASSDFQTSNGAALSTTLTVDGWLPSGAVAIRSVKVQWRFADPALTFDVATGKTGATWTGARIGTTGGGFSTGLQLGFNDALTRYWLEPAVSGSRTELRNFGQPMLDTDRSELPFADGTDTRWGLFGDGSREVASAALAKFLKWSRTARVSLSAENDGLLTLLGLSVLNLGRTDDRTRGWDLFSSQGDGVNEAASLGPYELLQQSLESISGDELRMTLRVGPPLLARSKARLKCDGEVRLIWMRSMSSWTVRTDSVAGNRFDWYLDSEPGPIRLARLEGAVRVEDGRLGCTISRVTVASPLGPLAFEAEPASLLIDRDGDSRMTLRTTIRSRADASTNFSCSFELTCLNGLWLLTPIRMPSWRQPAGLTIALSASGGSLDVSGLRLHPAAPAVADISAGIMQCSTRSWMFLLQSAIGSASASQAIVNLAVQQLPGSPMLRISLRGTSRVDPAKLFGPCDAAQSQVRVDVSRRMSLGASALDDFSDSTVTGRVAIDSDFSYDFSPATGPTVRFKHQATLYFDQLALRKDGTLATEFDAVGVHRLSQSAPRREITFQTVHRVEVLRTAERVDGLGCASLAILRPATAADAVDLRPQLSYLGDEDIAIGLRLAKPRDMLNSSVVRLPLRSRAQPVVVSVPSTSITGESLLWHPTREPSPSSQGGQGETTDPWFNRGRLAGRLHPSSLSSLASLQTRAVFNGSWPAEQEVLVEWAEVLAAPGEYVAGLPSPSTGAVQVPLAVGKPSAVARGADTSLVVELLATDPADPAPPRSISSALLQGIDLQRPSVIDDWARAEARRLSQRTAVVAIVRGGVSPLRAIARLFQASAVDDQVDAPTVPAASKAESVSSIIDCASTGSWHGRLDIPDDREAVAEVVESRAVVDGVETGRRTRVATSELWSVGGPAGTTRGLGWSSNRDLRFGTGGTSEPTKSHWPILRITRLRDIDAEHVRALPPLADITHWVLRGGDTTRTTFSTRSIAGDSVGPPLEMSFREARPDGSGGRDLGLTKSPALTATVGGVTWAMHRVSIRHEVGRPATDDIPSGVRVALVSPRNTVHAALPAPQPVDLPLLELGYRVPESAAGKAGAILMTDPFMSGVLRSAQTASSGYGALGVAPTGNAVRDVPKSSVPIAEEMLLAQEALDLSACAAILLQRFTKLAALPDTGQASNPASYGLAVGSVLRRLVSATVPSGVLPWLLGKKEGAAADFAPRFVWAEPLQGDRVRLTPIAVLAWREGGPGDPPAQILIAAADQVAGFGDIAARSTLALDLDPQGRARFAHCRVSLGLDRRCTTDATRVRAWRFAPSGACVGEA